MHPPALLASLLLPLLAAPLAAQSGSDDGLTSARSGAVAIGGGGFGNRGAGCGSGSTTTFFANNNGFAGNMMDFAVGASDVTLECLDVNNTSAAGSPIDIEVYAVPGTCVGKDIGDLCANGWVLIATGSGTAVGIDMPSPINLTHVGAPYVFSANASYGIYVNFANYNVSRAGYTNGGPTTCAGTHGSITTYYGKAALIPPCSLGTTFNPREFNGTLYTALSGPGGPVLTKIGTCPGPTTLRFTGCTANSGVAVLFGAAGTFTKPGNPCGGLMLGIANPTLGAVISANGAGDASLSFNAPPSACGRTVQGVDIASCLPSNAIVL
jgi:hypothetical protein